MIILGVDPGVSGALAFLSTEQLDYVGVYDMPILDGDIDPHMLHRIIGDHEPDVAMIERSHPHPRKVSIPSGVMHRHSPQPLLLQNCWWCQ